MSQAPPVRLGLLGCGWIAGNRLRQISAFELADVVMVADPDPAAIEKIAPWAPRARRVEGVEDFEPGHVDAVMVSTPSALHAVQATTLIMRGLPVFVQKPVGVCAGDVQRVLAAAAQADVALRTDLCYRHLNSAGAVKRTLADGTIGAPFLMEACFHNAYRPGAHWSRDLALAGGGALIDLSLHLLDLVMWLTDTPLELKAAHLRSRGRPWAAGDVEDFAVIDLESSNGAAVRIATSWDASTGLDAEILLRIYGERGSLEVANRRGSFFDFDARLYQGTRTDVLAADDGDAWQAEPLREWLLEVGRGGGFEAPLWIEEPMVIIDGAYASSRRAQGAEQTAAEGDRARIG